MSAIGPPFYIQWRVNSRAPGIYRLFLQELREGLRRARLDAVDVHVSSFYRDPWSNRLAGGEVDSQHLLGLAVDLVPLAGSVAGLHAGMNATMLVSVPGRRHVHVQTFRAGVPRRIGLFDGITTV